MIVNYPAGPLVLLHRGTNLPFRAFDKIRTMDSAEIVENKRLGAALALIKERQTTLPALKRRLDPAGHRRRNNLQVPNLAMLGGLPPMEVSSIRRCPSAVPGCD
jgi:hypothetical protein